MNSSRKIIQNFPIFIFFFIFLFGCCYSSSLNIWPQPFSTTFGNDTLYVNPDCFQFSIIGRSCQVLSEAVSRYFPLTFNNRTQKGVTNSQSLIQLCTLQINVIGDNLILDSTTDESYNLTISQVSGTQPKAVLSALSVFGALRGLETFSQLVDSADPSTARLVNIPLKIIDKPRFKFRGFLIDTARHYLSVNTLKMHIDALAYSKFNVLHWHIVDDQSFPFVSKAFPQLSECGAYNSVTHVYSPSDVQDIIRYAYFRGIRVIPEFDSPGHVRSWGKGYPYLLTQCFDQQTGQWDGSYGPLDPSKNSTYQFLNDLYTELSKVFIDDYFHLGGDEVPFQCWLSNPDIQKFMSEQGWPSWQSAKLEQYFEKRLITTVQNLGKHYIVWEEVWDNDVKLDQNTVVDVWKGWGQTWNERLADVTADGYQVILSAPWYLNYISYGSDWHDYYTVEPTDFYGSDAQKALVVGGEGAMWAEYVDDTNSISRTWPRACAISERLWSPKTVNDVDEASRRIQTHQCRLISRGINAQPITGPGFCFYEQPVKYFTPWS